MHFYLRILKVQDSLSCSLWPPEMWHTPGDESRSHQLGLPDDTSSTTYPHQDADQITPNTSITPGHNWHVKTTSYNGLEPGSVFWWSLMLMIIDPEVIKHALTFIVHFRQIAVLAVPTWCMQTSQFWKTATVKTMLRALSLIKWFVLVFMRWV